MNEYVDHLLTYAAVSTVENLRDAFRLAIFIYT